MTRIENSLGPMTPCRSEETDARRGVHDGVADLRRTQSSWRAGRSALRLSPPPHASRRGRGAAPRVVDHASPLTPHLKAFGRRTIEFALGLNVSDRCLREIAHCLCARGVCGEIVLEGLPASSVHIV